MPMMAPFWEALCLVLFPGLIFGTVVLDANEMRLAQIGSSAPLLNNSTNSVNTPQSGLTDWKMLATSISDLENWRAQRETARQTAENQRLDQNSKSEEEAKVKSSNRQLALNALKERHQKAQAQKEYQMELLARQAEESKRKQLLAEKAQDEDRIREYRHRVSTETRHKRRDRERRESLRKQEHEKQQVAEEGGVKAAEFLAEQTIKHSESSDQMRRDEQRQKKSLKLADTKEGAEKLEKQQSDEQKRKHQKLEARRKKALRLEAEVKTKVGAEESASKETVNKAEQKKIMDRIANDKIKAQKHAEVEAMKRSSESADEEAQKQLLSESVAKKARADFQKTQNEKRIQSVADHQEKAEKSKAERDRKDALEQQRKNQAMIITQDLKMKSLRDEKTVKEVNQQAATEAGVKRQAAEAAIENGKERLSKNRESEAQAKTDSENSQKSAIRRREMEEDKFKQQIRHHFIKIQRKRSKAKKLHQLVETVTSKFRKAVHHTINTFANATGNQAWSDFLLLKKKQLKFAKQEKQKKQRELLIEQQIVQQAFDSSNRGKCLSLLQSFYNAVSKKARVCYNNYPKGPIRQVCKSEASTDRQTRYSSCAVCKQVDVAWAHSSCHSKAADFVVAYVEEFSPCLAFSDVGQSHRCINGLNKSHSALLNPVTNLCGNDNSHNFLLKFALSDENLPAAKNWVVPAGLPKLLVLNRPPTSSPTLKPSSRPTSYPTMRPGVPTPRPTSSSPTARPSRVPTQRPSTTAQPTSAHPTRNPTSVPPTLNPTAPPTIRPSARPTMRPGAPSSHPTSSSPIQAPSLSPSLAPTTRTPTKAPTFKPQAAPTYTPSVNPTSQPTMLPGNPTPQPTSATPTAKPTASQCGPVLASFKSFSISSSQCLLKGTPADINLCFSKFQLQRQKLIDGVYSSCSDHLADDFAKSACTSAKKSLVQKSKAAVVACGNSVPCLQNVHQLTKIWLQDVHRVCQGDKLINLLKNTFQY